MIITDESHRVGMNAELNAIEATRKSVLAAQAARRDAHLLALVPHPPSAEQGELSAQGGAAWARNKRAGAASAQTLGAEETPKSGRPPK